MLRAGVGAGQRLKQLTSVPLNFSIGVQGNWVRSASRAALVGPSLRGQPAAWWIRGGRQPLLLPFPELALR